MKNSVQRLLFSLTILLSLFAIQHHASAGIIDASFVATNPQAGLPQTGVVISVLFDVAHTEALIFPISPVLPTPGVEFLQLNPTITGTFSYDTSAPGTPRFGGTVYPGIEMLSTVNVPGPSTIDVNPGVPRIFVMNGGASNDIFHIGNEVPDGIEELDLANPSPQMYTIDLGSDDHTGFFDDAPPLPAELDGLSVPVRFTETDTLHATLFSVVFDPPSDSFLTNEDLPVLSPDLLNTTRSVLRLNFSYDLIYNIDPSDYPTNEAFLAASNYFSDVDSVNAVFVADIDLTSLSVDVAIPEPSSLALLGLLGFIITQRRKRHQ